MSPKCKWTPLTQGSSLQQTETQNVFAFSRGLQISLFSQTETPGSVSAVQGCVSFPWSFKSKRIKCVSPCLPASCFSHVASGIPNLKTGNMGECRHSLDMLTLCSFSLLFGAWKIAFFVSWEILASSWLAGWQYWKPLDSNTIPSLWKGNKHLDLEAKLQFPMSPTTQGNTVLYHTLLTAAAHLQHQWYWDHSAGNLLPLLVISPKPEGKGSAGKPPSVFSTIMKDRWSGIHQEN